jgi:hypothetical protein
VTDDDDDTWDVDEPGVDLDEDDSPGSPDYRATVVWDRVTVIPWMRALVCSGPMTSMLLERERAGVTIADLTRCGGPDARELTVRVLARGGGRRAERVLVRWAATAGYERLWLPDRVVDLAPATGGRDAATRCTNCGADYREGTPEFWSAVRDLGMFPGWCPLCGGDMPQWRVGSGKR